MGVCKQSRWRHSVTVPHTRWRICVTMATLWQQQDGGYMLLWKSYGNNKMAAMRYYGNVMATTRWRLFYIFNSTVVDWTFFCVGQQWAAQYGGGCAVCKQTWIRREGLWRNVWGAEDTHFRVSPTNKHTEYVPCYVGKGSLTTFTSSLSNTWHQVRVSVSSDMNKGRAHTWRSTAQFGYFHPHICSTIIL